MIKGEGFVEKLLRDSLDFEHFLCNLESYSVDYSFDSNRRIIVFKDVHTGKILKFSDLDFED